MSHMQDRCTICDACCCDMCGGGQLEEWTYLGLDGEDINEYDWTCWRCLSDEIPDEEE